MTTATTINATLAPLTKLAQPLARVFLAAIFVLSGFSKISAYEGTQGYMEAFGVPGALLPLVISSEIVLGLLLIAGYQTRLAALLLAGFSLGSALVFHTNFADQIQFIMFMKNLAITGGLLLVFAHGAGSYAFDKE